MSRMPCLPGMFTDPPNGLPEPPAATAFDGATYTPATDHERLSGQMERVWKLLNDGQWRTLREIADQTQSPEASVSARIRDLRKDKYGAHEVARRLRYAGSYGTWEYRLDIPPQQA